MVLIGAAARADEHYVLHRARGDGDGRPEAPPAEVEVGIRDVDLEVRRGELVVITGRVGSGKTTLLRAVLGLLPLDEGELRWEGARVEADGEGITLVVAHGDGSFAVAVDEALADEFSATAIGREIADEAGGGAGGNDRLAAGGGATDALGETAERVRKRLLRTGPLAPA